LENYYLIIIFFNFTSSIIIEYSWFYI